MGEFLFRDVTFPPPSQKKTTHGGKGWVRKKVCLELHRNISNEGPPKIRSGETENTNPKRKLYNKKQERDPRRFGVNSEKKKKNEKTAPTARKKI